MPFSLVALVSLWRPRTISSCLKKDPHKTSCCSGRPTEMPQTSAVCPAFGAASTRRATTFPLIEAHAVCAADLNGDGTRGIDDMLILLASYDAIPVLGVEDLDDDGFVGVNDVLEFLLYFGTECD